MRIRRVTTIALAAMTLLPLRAQAQFITGLTLTQLSQFSTQIDFFVSWAGPGAFRVDQIGSAGQFYFTSFFGPGFTDELSAYATLVGGAVAKGAGAPPGPTYYTASYTTSFVDGSKRTGSFVVDPTGPRGPIAGCTDLVPNQNGLYGNFDTYYFQTCGPGAAVHFTLTTVGQRVEFADAVLGTPEPATLALTATGLVGLFGVVRRRRRLSQV